MFLLVLLLLPATLDQVFCHMFWLQSFVVFGNMHCLLYATYMGNAFGYFYEIFYDMCWLLQIMFFI